MLSIQFWLIALFFLVCPISFSYAECTTDKLNSLSSETRHPRGEYDKDLSVQLENTYYSGALAAELFDQLGKAKQVSISKQSLATQLFAKRQLMESRTHHKTILDNRTSCAGGETLSEITVCEKSYLDSDIKCLKECVYVNYAEDCIPD